MVYYVRENKMRKLKLYLDTSVLNFALSEEAALVIQKKATTDLLDEIQQGKHEGYISEQVLVEINRAPKPKAALLNNLVLLGYKAIEIISPQEVI